MLFAMSRRRSYDDPHRRSRWPAVVLLALVIATAYLVVQALQMT
jgi:hypothetical protein